MGIFLPFLIIDKEAGILRNSASCEWKDFPPPAFRLPVGQILAFGSLVDSTNPKKLSSQHRKVDIRLPGRGNSNSHGARPVHQINHDDKVDSDQ